MSLYEILSTIPSYIGYVALTLFIWWLVHPDSFDKLIVYAYRLAAYISKQHRKRYIAKYIEHSVARALRRLEKHIKDEKYVKVSSKLLNILGPRVHRARRRRPIVSYGPVEVLLIKPKKCIADLHEGHVQEGVEFKFYSYNLNDDELLAIATAGKGLLVFPTDAVETILEELSSNLKQKLGIG